MEAERVLSLDISTKTGWNLTVSSADSLALEWYGQVEKIAMPDSTYPGSFVDWAYLCYNEIVKLIDRLKPTVLVIEETAGNSKTSHSQKILEFIHFLVAKLIKETSIKSVYLLTGEWRSETVCKMTDEEKLHNKEVRKYKTRNKTSIAYDSNGKRVGQITKKHVAIRRANEIFGKDLKVPLRKKDEDTAEALMLAYCYHLRRLRIPR